MMFWAQLGPEEISASGEHGGGGYSTVEGQQDKEVGDERYSWGQRRSAQAVSKGAGDTVQ
jgi:hypothetical protein